MNYFKIFCLSLALVSFTSVANASNAPENDEFDVVIVGAGLSGLTCAKQLSSDNPNLKIAVLEARDRLGGRAWTTQVNGKNVEKGGEFLDSREDHPEIHNLVEELGLELDSVRVNRTFSLFKGQLGGMKEILPTIKSLVKKLQDHTKKQNDFVYHGNDLVFTALQDQLDLKEDEKLLLDCILSDENGIGYSDAASFSAHEMLERLEEYKKLASVKSVPFIGNFLTNKLAGAIHYRVKDGNTSMVNAIHKSLGKNVDVRTSCPVQRLTRKDNGLYTLKCQGYEHALSAQKLIISAPFSTLRFESGILDDAALSIPTELRKVIDSMTYGTNSKAIVPTTGCEDITYGLNLDAGFTCWGTPGGLTCLSGGLLGKQAGENPNFLNGTNALLNSLGVKKTGDIEIVNWSKDPYAKGSYRAIAKGDTTSFIPSKILVGMAQFADPLNNNTLFFTGEHTCLDYGYMNSAVRSGLTVAKFLK